jgi:hypothetical protein
MMQERRRPDTADASVAVTDAWQGRGLGGMLLERLARNLAMLRLFERIGAVWVTSRYDDDLPRVEQQARAPREARLVAAAAHPIPSLGHRTVRPVASGPVWTGGPASARAASACDPPMLRLQHEPVEERGIAGGIRASRGVSSGAWL